MFVIFLVLLAVAVLSGFASRNPSLDGLQALNGLMICVSSLILSFIVGAFLLGTLWH